MKLGIVISQSDPETVFNALRLGSADDWFEIMNGPLIVP